MALDVQPFPECFRGLPPAGRVWIFPFVRPLSNTQVSALKEGMRCFGQNWQSHGRPVALQSEIIEDRFLIVAGSCAGEAPSGCGIDSLMRSVRERVEQLGLELAEYSKIFYRENGTIEMCSAAEFSDLVQRGRITGQTIVFQNSVASPEALERWQVPLADSYYAARFMRT